MAVLFFLIALSISVLWLVQQAKLKKQLKLAQAEKAALTQEQSNALHQLEQANLRIAQLKPYEGILNADQKAAQIIGEARANAALLVREATAQANNMQAQADTQLKEATKAAKETRIAANEKAKTLKENAETLLANATRRAGQIIEVAEQKAVEIGGDAYKALKNVGNLEKAAQALKNVIEGYGNQYLLPPDGLLDEMAEQFGFVEAGKELQNARENSRLMVQNNTAARCDYVDRERKETAVNFVLDAFNGKVDSILAESKTSNYGTLKQRLQDAFALVNNLGRAFRDARITEAYLEARTQELYWATAVKELKLKEREEQKQIKDQIREEEKARRDYEKAIKEAQREEEIIRKAMEKAQRDANQAQGAQREKYEAMLQELADKLTVAEQKNQKALSMAQQTKTGVVYIISNIGSFGEHVFKIGMTRRLDPMDRIKELADASVPFEFDVHALIASDNAPKLEHELHQHFALMQMNKVNKRKEFFRIDLGSIRKEVQSLKIEAKWTMAAEAREYRESLLLEQAMATDAEVKQQWMRQQNAVPEMAALEDE